MRIVVVGLLLAAACHPGSKTAPPPASASAPDPAPATAAAPAPARVATDASAADSGEATATDAPAPSVLPLQPDPGFMPMRIWGDPYSVTGEPTLKGTTLVVPVQYGGGCADHAFTLKPSPRTADAPATQQLALHHDANGDKCKALLRKDVTLQLGDQLEDCTRAVVLTVSPAKGYELKLDPPVGCD